MKVKKVSVFIVVVVFHIVVLGVVYLSTRPDKPKEEIPPGKPGKDVVENGSKPKPPAPDNGSKPNLPVPDNSTESSGKVMIHTVMKGEFLGKIASKYKVSVKAIMDLNKIKDPNKILPGHKLKIPSKK